MSFAGRSGLRHIALASERPKGLLAGHQAIVLSLGDGFVMRPPQMRSLGFRGIRKMTIILNPP